MTQSLDRIEAILAEIEALDAASNGKLRQSSDRECFDVACRIERQMQQALGETGDDDNAQSATTAPSP